MTNKLVVLCLCCEIVPRVDFFLSHAQRNILKGFERISKNEFVCETPSEKTQLALSDYLVKNCANRRERLMFVAYE